MAAFGCFTEEALRVGSGHNALKVLRWLQERLSEAARLAQEMAVQAAAIEAARSNVEHHYSYICTHFKEFTSWCVSPQVTTHMLNVEL